MNTTRQRHKFPCVKPTSETNEQRHGEMRGRAFGSFVSLLTPLQPSSCIVAQLVVMLACVAFGAVSVATACGTPFEDEKPTAANADAQDADQSASDSANEINAQTDEDFDAELDALITELEPPTVEEILSWYEPIPSVEEVLAQLAGDPKQANQKRLTPEADEEVSELMQQFADAAAAMDDAKAASLAKKIAAIRAAQQGTNYWQTLDAMSMAQLHTELAELAAPIRAELAKTREQDRQAHEFYVRGAYEQAARTNVGALRTVLKYLGKSSPDFAPLAGTTAHYLSKSGRPIPAEAIYRAVLASQRISRGIDDPRTTYALNGILNLLGDRGNLDQAEQLAIVSLDITFNTLGVAHTDTAASLNNLALVESNRGNNTLAKQLFRYALDIERDVRGIATPDCARVLRSLSACSALEGDYASAECYLRGSLQILRLLYTGAHPDIGQCYLNLAHFEADQGRYEQAASYAEAAIAAFRATIGEQHPRMAEALSLQALALRATGQLSRAEQICREALQICRSRLSDDSPAITSRLQNLAAVLQDIGRVGEAEELYREALAGIDKHENDSNVIGACVMYDLGLLLSHRPDHAARQEARRLLANSRAIRKQLRDRQIYLSAAAYARVCDDPAEAEAAYREAIDQIESLRNLGTGDELSRSRYFSVLSKARAYSGMIQMLVAGQNDQSRSREARCAEAFTFLEREHGQALRDLIGPHAGRLAEPVRAGAGAAAGRNSPSDRRFSKDEEAQHSAERVTEPAPRLNATPTNHDVVVSSAMSAQDVSELLNPGERVLAFDLTAQNTVAILVRPSQQRSAVTHTNASGNEHEGVDTVAVWNSHTSIIENAPHVSTDSESSLRTAGASIESAASLFPRSWEREIQNCQRLLVTPDGPLNRLPLEMLVWNRASSELWIDVGPPVVYGPSSTIMLAMRQRAQERASRSVGSANNPCPQLIAVGDPIFNRTFAGSIETEDRLPSNMTASNNQQGAGDTSTPQHGILLVEVVPDSNAGSADIRPGDVLLTYDGVAISNLAQLADAIKGAQRRIDDARSNASPDAIVSSTNEHTGQDHARATRTGDTSEPLAPNAIATVPVTVWRNGAVIHAAVSTGLLGVRPARTPMPDALVAWREIHRNEDETLAKFVIATTRSAFGDTLAPLPGTRIEVGALAEVTRRSGAKDDAVKVLTGKDATVTNLFNAAQSPRFLHIATHGKIESGVRVRDSALALTVPENPTPDDFGFLRLQDLLDKWGGKLDGTELVVLSGCETATGRLEAADGFVGLTWGFLYAGADSVIASLWKVDDAATALLMTRLYENLLGVYDEERMGFAAGTEMPKAEALHEAKRWLRHQKPEDNRRMLAELGMDTDALQERYRAERGRTPTEDPQELGEPFDYSAPKYWAAFVLIGSPD